MPPRVDIEVREGDCLSVMRELPPGGFSLAYVDPPFFTRKVHRLAPRDRSREFSFQDLWASQNEYGQFLWDRILEVRRLLADDGSVFLHCDHHAVHIARIVLDEVFGAENFRSEIIWHYRRWSNSQKGLLPAHQTVLYYSRSERFTFHETLTDYSPATNVDQILQRRTRDGHNKSIYERDADGNVVHGVEKRGVPLSDVWDIPFLNPKAKERTGYPTQKPLALLERIIRLATNEGDRVLDPFCGSGTALAAAQALKRSALGIDVSSEAVEMSNRRLKESVRSHSRLLEVGRDSYRNADGEALALLQGLDIVPVQRNSGIDALLKRNFEGGPVPIRVQRDGETTLEAARKLARASFGKGVKVMFLIVRSRGGELPLGNALPPNVVTIGAPGLGILEHLERIDVSV